MAFRQYESFVFTHIPKCGGTSFRKYLCGSALNSNISKDLLHIPGFNNLANDKNINQLKPNELKILQKKEIKLLADHSFFNVHSNKGLNIKKPFYYTILRDPISRVISHYNFFYYKLGYGGCKGLHINELAEEKLLKVIQSISNIQTAYIGNKKQFEELSSKVLLKRAIHNLEHHLSCFGILEEMDKSNQLLQATIPSWLVLSSTIPVENKNKINSKLEKPNSTVVSIITKHNHSDKILYDFGKQLLGLKHKYISYI